MLEKPTTVGLDQIAAAAALSVDLATTERAVAIYQPFEPTMGMYPVEPDPIFIGY
ncbi:MAG TPA: hypothetical protein VHG91_04435 [Longimicrobium sp.]|nr:hypothetical protein [Longimicrobium sp.]